MRAVSDKSFALPKIPRFIHRTIKLGEILLPRLAQLLQSLKVDLEEMNQNLTKLNQSWCFYQNTWLNSVTNQLGDSCSDCVGTVFTHNQPVFISIYLTQTDLEQTQVEEAAMTNNDLDLQT